MPTPTLTPATVIANISIDWFSIITLIIAVFSLIISIVNFYETTGKKYNGFVYPTSQLILSWIGETPCIITDCLFVNHGARPGYVEDLLLLIKDQSVSGTKTQFRPFLTVVESDFDALAEEGDKNQKVKNYSSVWLSGKESIKQTIIFVPNNCLFDIQTHTAIEEEIFFRSFDPKETNSANWNTSEVTCKYTISDNNIANWKNDTENKTVILESTQLIEKRTDLFKAL